MTEKQSLTAGIYTTGAYLKPYKLENGLWAWVAMGFEDDSYEVGSGDLVNPSALHSKDIEHLLFEDEDEDEDEDDFFNEELDSWIDKR